MLNVKLASSLEKIFPDQPPDGKEHPAGSALKGELYSFQIAYACKDECRLRLQAAVESPIEEYITLYDVGYVPSLLPAFPENHDADYLRTAPGLFPDVLRPLNGSREITALRSAWKSLWVSVKLPESVPAGRYPIRVSLRCERMENPVLWSGTFTLDVIGETLPPQRLLCTQWFHYDCLAVYYGVESFSETHWELIERYLRNAAQYGVNMILTPILTPPLDTEKGAERPTVQLLKVSLDNGQYSFDFSLLKRFIRMAARCGIRAYEISHLFTQWGAAAAPKIMASVDGAEKRIFGWDTVASSDEYRRFLAQMLTELKQFLKDEGVLGDCYFHISDEPNANCLESYRLARESISGILQDCNVMDALSEYEFYERGLVQIPVVANDRIHTFIENGVRDLWTYYCCGQTKEVSNRFISMPSYRNRILGYQLYKYGIKGFLHWGFNFWFSVLSQFPVDPYGCTDADGAFPSGDSFVVYPGKNGEPVSSIRQLVFYEALQDLRALELLERHMGKEAILQILENEFQMELRFDRYPKSPRLLQVRQTVNTLLAGMRKE